MRSCESYLRESNIYIGRMYLAIRDNKLERRKSRSNWEIRARKSYCMAFTSAKHVGHVSVHNSA